VESDLWAQLQIKKEDFILCGDLNCRSNALGCAGSNKNGEILEEIILENDFVVLNDSSPAYNRNDYWELLDYIICIPRVASKCVMFKAELNELLVSDHIPVEIWIAWKFPTTNNLSKHNAFDFDKANWQLFRQELEMITQTSIQLCDIVIVQMRSR
jgi:hypothetical protein